MQRISIDPDPPQAGKALRICYDFFGSGLTSTTLKIHYVPTSYGTDTVTVSESPAGSSCKEILCPAASSLTIVDGSGVSQDLASVIT